MGNNFPAYVFEIEGTDHKYIFDAEEYEKGGIDFWRPEIDRWAKEAEEMVLRERIELSSPVCKTGILPLK